VYRTCLYCTHDLGHNEVLEELPIGRRVAFDAEQGRLWVICRSCARWNLVPFDGRLEAIDHCEQLFRDSRKRFSTDHIGLARLSEGLELVRIGAALRPEFAAWRYGDRFASRRRRNILVATTVGVAGVGAVIGLHVLIGGVAGVQLLFQGASQAYQRRRIAARFVPESGGRTLTLTRRDIGSATLHSVPGDAGWALTVPARFDVPGRWAADRVVDDEVQLTGANAVLALGHLLPAVAGISGSRPQVQRAVGLIEDCPTIESLTRKYQRYWSDGTARPGPLSKLAVESRLALEMLANESSERRWLEGELKLLEHQWREADRLAAIADSLAVPDGVADQLETFRKRDR
jgi:hypothetical protein